MSDNTIASKINCTVNSDKQDDLLNLALIRQDRFAIILFLIGTLLSLYITYQEEQAIVKPEENQTSTQIPDAPAISIAELRVVFNLIFLIASIILAYDAYQRLRKQKADINTSTSPKDVNNFIGSELVTLGNIVRVIGYISSTAGNQIRAENPVS